MTSTADTLYAWPTVDDVAIYLRATLSSLPVNDQTLIGQALAMAESEARVVPDWRTAAAIPARVFTAIVELAGETYKGASRTAGIADIESVAASLGNIRYRCLVQMGRLRGGRPVAR